MVDTDIASGDSYLAYRLKKKRKKRSLTHHHHHNIPIDDGLKSVIVSVTTKYYGDADRATITCPDGSTLKPTTASHLTSIFEIYDPVPGMWVLNFPEYVRKYSYQAQAVSKDPIQFDYNFIYQKNPDEDSPPIALRDPLRGTLKCIMGIIN